MVSEGSSERPTKVSKLELLPGVGPFITIFRALNDQDNISRADLGKRNERLYIAYLGLQLVGLEFTKVYVLTEGFTRQCPNIMAFY